MTVTWRDPKDFDVGEDMSVAFMNQIRDELDYLFSVARQLAFEFPATCDPRAITTLSAAFTANQCHYNRIYGSGDVSALRIVVGASAGNISAAIYDTSGSGLTAVPANRLDTSGSVACPSTGAADVALAGTTTVTHGAHWFALSASSGSAQFARNGNGTAAGWTNGVIAAQNTAHPAPASATPASLASHLIVMVGVP